MQATTSIYHSLLRQVTHWLQAASRLSVLDNLASGNAWHGIEHKMGTILKECLQKSVDEVVITAMNLKKQLENAPEPENLRSIKRGLLQLRNKYLKAEETIHFYTVAINSRTTPSLAALLRACDILCVKSMQELMQPLGKRNTVCFNLC